METITKLLSKHPQKACMCRLAISAFLFLVLINPVFVFSKESKHFTEISPNVFVFRDTCNVYVIRCGSTAIVIDCGSAKMLGHLSEIGIQQISWVLFTHHHRDQCQGVSKMIEHGSKIAVPAGEKGFFDDVESFWKKADYYRCYREGFLCVFKPDTFVLRESVSKIEKVAENNDLLPIDSLDFKAVRTPGHTPGHTSYIVDVSGKKIAFTGDLIHSEGKIWNFWSLQYVYNDYGRRGAKEILDSLARLAEYKPDLALPSHGKPIKDLPAAADKLQNNLEAVLKYYEHKPYKGNWVHVDPPDWLRLHKYGSICYTIIDSNGNGFTIDPGFEPVYKKVVKDPDIKNIEGIWITHYHDDHVATVNKVKQRYGAEVYAHESLVDILENPLAFNLPCMIDEPIKVDHVLKHGESFNRRGIKFTNYNFPSQTYWHAGLLFEKDGKKYFVAGDAFYNPSHANDENCRNYSPLEENDGLLFSAKLLKKLKPDYLITGHWGIWRVSPENFDDLIDYLRKLRPLAEKLIAQPEVNMGMDEQWVSCYPYRTKTVSGRQIPVEVRIRNHLPKKVDVKAELISPAGWMVSPAVNTVAINKKSGGQLKFNVNIPENTTAGRYIITSDITFAGTYYGQLAEAIVDVEDTNSPASKD